MISPQRSARIIGALFLAAFLLYGIGSAIATGAETGSAAVTVGVVMMLTNSVAVVTIGLLMAPIIRPHSAVSALIYLMTRVVEAVALAASAVALLVADATANALAYNLGMTVLGIGSLFLCATLFRARLVPRFLAAWGFVGYLVFAAGSVLELIGVAGAGLIGAIPGGLFEIAFAGWLLVRGLSPADAPAPTADRVSSRPL